MNKEAMLTLLKRLKKRNPRIKDSTFDQAVKFVKNNPDRMFDRKNMNGHFSASGYAFQNEKLWFIKHPYLHTILLPGGHVEPGETPLFTAQREYLEETGFSTENIDDELYGLRDLNIIHIPANPIKNEGAHMHVDLRYELNINRIPRNLSELPTFLIDRSEAPGEFHIYYDDKLD